MKRLLRKKLSRICYLFQQNNWCFCIRKSLSLQVSPTRISSCKLDWTKVNKIYEKDSSSFWKSCYYDRLRLLYCEIWPLLWDCEIFLLKFCLANVLTNEQQAIQKITDFQCEAKCWLYLLRWHANANKNYFCDFFWITLAEFNFTACT